jgi:hypothetical protein
MSVKENELLQLLGEELYSSIPRVIPRRNPPFRYKWLTKEDFAGHKVVIAEENYEGKLRHPVLAILVECTIVENWYDRPGFGDVWQYSENFEQLRWGYEEQICPFVYKVRDGRASICRHGGTGRYGGGYTESSTQLPLQTTNACRIFFPLQNFLAFHHRDRDRKFTRWLMSSRAKCSNPDQHNILRRLFLQQVDPCDLVLAYVPFNLRERHKLMTLNAPNGIGTERSTISTIPPSLEEAAAAAAAAAAATQVEAGVGSVATVERRSTVLASGKGAPSLEATAGTRVEAEVSSAGTADINCCAVYGCIVC